MDTSSINPPLKLTMNIIKYIRKDWPMIPLIVFFMAGYIVPFVELNSLDNQEFDSSWIIVGVILFSTGTVVELMVRHELMENANFPGFNSTKLLQIVKDHRLITTGLFTYIRHPLYFGRIMLSFGWVLFFSSLLGAVLMMTGSLFLLVRIHIEEKMLFEEFGSDYRDYQKITWRLIPFIY